MILDSVSKIECFFFFSMLDLFFVVVGIASIWRVFLDGQAANQVLTFVFRCLLICVL